MAGEVTLKAKIWGDVTELLSSLQKAEKAMNTFSRKMTSVGKELSTALTLPIAAFGITAVKEFGESEKAMASLEAQVRANGKSVDTTMEKYRKFSKQMAEVAVVDDDVVASLLQVAEGMQAPDPEKAVKDAIGLSKAYGIDLTQAVSVATKAQYGQYQLLGRMLPAVKAAKTETEKAALTEKIFANAFEVAKAQSEAGIAPLEKTSIQMKNLTEDYGRLIMQGITPFINKIQQLLTWLASLSDTQKKWIVTIALGVAAIGPMLLVIGKVPAVLAAMSSGFRLVMAAVKGLWGLMVANPWLAVIAAIVAAGAALAIYLSKASTAERIQQSLNDVNQKAAASIASEKVSMEHLLAIAKDENRSKEERRKAIKMLNDISPEYLGNLSLENINTIKAKQATDKYIESLLRKAKVTAAEERLVEIEKELLAIQNGQSDAAEPSFWQNLGNAVISFGNAQAFANNTVRTTSKNLQDEISSLNKEREALTGVVMENSSALLNENKIITGGTGELKKQRQELEAIKQLKSITPVQTSVTTGAPALPGGGAVPNAPTPPATTADLDETKVDLLNAGLEKTSSLIAVINQTSFSGLFNAFQSVASGIASVIDNMKKQFATVQEKVGAVAAGIGQAIMGVVSIWQQISSQHFANEQAKLDAYYDREKARINGSVMDQVQKQKAIEKLDKESEKKRKELMRKQAKDQKAAALIQAVIAGALAVVQALGSLPGPAGIVMAVIVGALAAAQIALIASQPLPELAEGGLATAPTMAVVGDNPNAGVDPEVISPLSKLKNMIGSGGAMQVEVVGRVAGNDLLFVMKKAEANRYKVTG